MSKQSEKDESRKESIAELRKLGVRPGATVYTNVDHVARSGMSREISLYIVCPVTRRTNGKTKRTHQIVNITGYVGDVLGWRRANRGGLVVGGCGMDMCFKTVYELGRRMFPKGGSLDHTNGIRQVQAERAGERIETDGGYLLEKLDL